MTSRRRWGACTRHAAMVGFIGALCAHAAAQVNAPVGDEPNTAKAFNLSESADRLFIPGIVPDGGNPVPRGGSDGTDGCIPGSPISGSGSVVTGNAGATNTAADSAGACGASATSVDVWFTYTPTATGNATFNFCPPGGATYDTVLEAYTNCLSGGGARITCNDDFCGLQSQITVPVTAGTPIKIRVAGFSTAVGTGTMVYSIAGPCNIDCAPTAVPENEPCGGNTNGGCNSTPPAFQVIPCNSIICGTAWADANMRDTDWYQFTTTAANTTVTVTLRAEMPMVTFLLTNVCPPVLVASADAPTCGSVGTMTATVGPGTYVVFAATGTLAGGIFSGFPCGNNSQYELSVNFGVPCGPQITSFFPTQGSEGDIITINGSGFGNNPDNLCLLVRNGNDVIPFRVLTATDTQMTAVLRAVRPDAVPGPLMMEIGNGDVGTFTPAFRDVIPEDPNGAWVWTTNFGGQALTTQLFTPIPRTPPPPIQWLFGHHNVDRLCLFIGKPWMPNTYVRVTIRLRCPPNAQGYKEGFDNESFCIRFRGGGNARHCALRICDVIQCVIFQRRGILVNCRVLPTPNPDVWKIEVTKKDANGNFVPISWGCLDVCIFMPHKFHFPSGNFATPFYGAVLDGPDPGPVTVSNIGHSAEDGVTVDFGTVVGGVRAFFDVFVDLDYPMRMMRVDAWGTWNGTPYLFLGGGRLWGRPNSCLDAYADFSAIQSSLVRVEVYQGNQFMGSATMPNGTLGVVQGLPGQRVPLLTDCGKLAPFPPSTPCIIWNWNGPFVFTPTNGSPLPPGNSLRMLAANSPGPINNITQLDMAFGMGNTPNEPPFEVRIRDAFATGCPCDWNHDGRINSQDFFDFTTAFFTQMADFNGDGVTNSQDFFDFLNCFFGPPPGCN